MNLFKSIFKAKKKNIFIHIPKAGGSTFVGLLKDSVKINASQKNIPTHLIERIGDTEIKHVDFNKIERPFKLPEIFITDTDFYKKYNVFMIVRNPVDRIQSEFNFQYHILNGKEGNKNAAIISRLKKLPTNLNDYVSNPETQNYQCKFLLGRKIADSTPITELDFEIIINTIKELPIHCGTTDNYEAFLNTFQSITNINLKKEIILRKKTPNTYNKKIDDTLRTKILKLNSYDAKLYEFVKSLFDETALKQSNQFQFKDKDEFIV